MSDATFSWEDRSQANVFGVCGVAVGREHASVHRISGDARRPVGESGLGGKETVVNREMRGDCGYDGSKNRLGVVAAVTVIGKAGCNDTKARGLIAEIHGGGSPSF